MTHPHHDQLLADGWKFYGPNIIDEHGYYCKKFADLPERCHNEGKQEIIVATPYYRDCGKIQYRWSIELKINHGITDDFNVMLYIGVYQLPPDQWGKHIAILKAACIAAHNEGKSK